MQSLVLSFLHSPEEKLSSTGTLEDKTSGYTMPKDWVVCSDDGYVLYFINILIKL